LRAPHPEKKSTAMRRLSLLLAALLLSAFALSACGSSDALEGKSATEVLKETFGPDHPVKSGRLDLGVKFSAQGLQGLNGPINARLSGPFQSLGGKTLPAFDLKLSLDASGQSFTAGAVSTGKKGFLSIAGRTYDIGSALYTSLKTGYGQASSSTKKSDGPSFSSLGIQPLDWLTSPVKKGEEEVGGTNTVHVAAQVDVEKLLVDVDKLLRKAGNVAVPGTTQKVPTGLTAEQRRTITESVKTADFEVWSGMKDGTLRRLRVAISFAVPQASQSKAGGLQSGDVTLDLTIGALNEKQTIAEPKNARPIAELTQALQGAFGGALGGSSGSGSSGSGSSGSSGSGSSGAGSSGSQSRYLDCLQAAGADLTKVQRCASELGK
jgi:hypothetical protein